MHDQDVDMAEIVYEKNGYEIFSRWDNGLLFDASVFRADKILCNVMVGYDGIPAAMLVK